MLAPKNPRRSNTYAHRAFALYKTGITVSQWREACRAEAGSDTYTYAHMIGYLGPDIEAGHIKVG